MAKPTAAFQTKVEKILGYIPKNQQLSESWTTGGLTGGSCWGGKPDQAIAGNPEPAFQELDIILTKLCPKMSFLVYKKLESEIVERDRKTEYEYYGNCYHKGIKSIRLDKLEKFLAKNKLWAKSKRKKKL